MIVAEDMQDEPREAAREPYTDSEAQTVVIHFDHTGHCTDCPKAAWLKVLGEWTD